MKISWTSSKIEIAKTHSYGKGVFAKKGIRKGELVAVFGGYIVALKDLPGIKKKNRGAYDTILNVGYQVTDKLVLSPISKSQLSVIEYLNHSCNPNCGFHGQLNLVAMKNIRKGEEVTMDYAMCITSNVFAMKCQCATTLCRGSVSGSSWKNPVLQKRYRGYFQPYIEEKIKKTRHN